MTPRKPIVAGNWKMNGDTAANSALLAALVSHADAKRAAARGEVGVVVCPPFPYLAQAGAQLTGSGFELGAQNLSEHDNGAFTGEVSGMMLLDIGCDWVIVGHSERRSLLGETDEIVAAKAARALGAGLGVMICIGETLQERERNLTEAVLARQLQALEGLTAMADPAKLVIAYEPVWAIGTGRSASAEQAQQVHAFVRARLAAIGFSGAPELRILYGGSVKPANAQGMFEMPDIDGGLIGGASLSADEFIAIVRAADLARG
ncbi:MAG: triose-phosphate isomerase [Quisquiliibacterium sp.]